MLWRDCDFSRPIAGSGAAIVSRQDDSKIAPNRGFEPKWPRMASKARRFRGENVATARKQPTPRLVPVVFLAMSRCPVRPPAFPPGWIVQPTLDAGAVTATDFDPADPAGGNLRASQ
jgi:hypothetical protein